MFDPHSTLVGLGSPRKVGMPPERSGEVSEQINDLMKYISELETAMTYLGEKISPVLSNTVKETDYDEAPPAPSMCGVAAVIHEQGRRIGRVTSNVQSIISRIEL